MSIAAAENAGPGPCDLQDPLWVKMSAITGSVTKKRKKSDAKPQSQINKCLNEKRRRTQENQYIDELAELISATDMSSGKTDKCQILQRTVDQIRHIRQQENSNSHAVQQGEVSSSNPNIISNDQVGPMLLEALDGFLFVVNTEGRVEYVTDNISQYINYTKEDVFGKDIYNIIHHGDHNTFMPSLLPMSSLGWTSEPQPQTKNRVFNCRFLVKPPDDKEETMEEKQQRVNKYETMQICSALLTNNSDRLESGDVSSESSDIGPCVMCVARRIPHNEKPITTAIQQFTVKLDPSGKILALDNSWLSQSYSTYLNKDLVGTAIQDLCHPLDLSELTAHLKGTLEGGERSSPMYRLCVSQDKFLNVKANSKLFKGTEMSGYDTDYVMSINSIIGDNDLTPLEGGQLSNNKLCSGHSSNRCANNSNNNNGNNNNNVGGPLMSVAHLNGQVSGVSGRGLTSQNATTSNNSVTFNTSDNSCNPLTSLTTSSNPFNQFSGNMDLEFELFPSSTWDLDSSSGWVERPESRASGPPNSRPPSQPAAASPSPQGTTTFNSNSAVQPSHCSPLRAYSPTSGNPTFSNSFPFSPLQESPTPMNNIAGAVAAAAAAAAAGANGATTSSLCKRIESQDKGCPSTSGTSAPNTPSVETQNSVVSTESVRLRNLLTKGASASEDSQDNPVNDADKPNKHRILKTLLNQQDDDEYHSEHSSRVRTSPSSAPKQNTEQPNIMLLQLLNEKNDDDDEEARVGLKKSNELLQKLLKNQDEERKQKEQTNQEDDPLLRSLGFQNTTPSPSQPNENSQVPRKRPGEEMNMNSSMKRPRDGTHPPASAPTSTNKHLWEKNKMLASLLAKQPEQPTKIPPIDASVISATPQDKLPRVTDRLKQPPQQQQQQQPWTTSRMQQPIGNNTITTTATSARTPLQNLPRQQLPRQAANVYLSHMLSQVSQTQQQRPQVEQIDSEFISGGEYRQPNTDPNVWNNQSTDPDLNDILEQFVDFTSNQTNEDSSETTNDLLSVAEVPHDIVVNETMAINAIQKSLMLIEAKVNSTSSSITIPGTPPAYSTALGNAPVVTTSHNYQAAALYQQQQQPRMRFNAQPGIRQSAAQFTPQQQLHIQQQQRSNLIQQQQMKQRLLQQQQQQQLLIPSNATATDQINTGIHNIDSLLNNTVAPNVSLQRSSVTDSQVSPGYGGSVQMPSGHRLAHSYSHPSTLSQHPVNNNFSSGQQVSATARLSPHSPAGILSFSHPQPLSPRVSQGNYGNSPRMFNVNQVRQQQQPTTQQQLQQQQRSMPSPGTPASARQSPFPAETFPPPASPTASQFPPVQIPNANNPSTQYRLQRTTSTPSATTQLPGNASSTVTMTSEFVRQELRAIVGARTQQQQQRVPNSLQNNLSGQVSQDDLDALGLTFEMSSAGEPVVSDGPAKSWAIGSAGSAPSSSRTTIEEVAQGDPKASLLQKLLSE
ncbi:nuclear receptor coactivator 2 isoform X11 [Leptopilina heterotoma]|uniref:nuclear receptor coactivator 2 isoform X11 n=1 Tax=Leptopilina heterotoma TaxID=63436 RepID=UPI001CA84C74|nr:nuclear receptor coactivator 2 isoform X11 [Leptopilina heterotoma]